MQVHRYLWLSAVALTLAASASTRAAEPGKVVIKADKERIDFLIGDELVGRYQISQSVFKPYMWPLHGPGGVPITRAWPMEKGKAGESVDHVHQKSLWFCHGDVIPEGIELKERVKGVDGVDFWSENANAGRILCTGADEPRMEKGHGWITTRNVWQTAGKTKVLDETRTIHLYDLGDSRLLVFDIDLHASACPITFGDTKEGSFGIRINDVMREKPGNGKLENAEGKTGMSSIWGHRSVWCDYSGTIDGKKVGLAIFDDRDNPPAYWHSRDYGLMAANPFGRNRSGFPATKGNTDLLKLSKDQHLKLRYGVLLHSGDAKEGKVAEQYAHFLKLKQK